jgi:N-acetylneuraminic acid mutarotase
MRNMRALSWKAALAIGAVILLPAVQAGGGSPGLRCRPSCVAHPSARGYAHMVYDWTTGTAYIFGGIDEITPNLDYPLFDVWAYNVRTGNWKQRLNAPELYNAFQRDAVALDPRSKKVVLYSTFVNCNWDADPWTCGVETWLYDTRSNTFENATSGTEPPLRWGARMVYDAAAHRAILFGGADGYTSETLNETWTYDFEANVWTQMNPENPPPPHHFGAMVYHPRAHRTVLFGGYDVYADETLSDTWSYDSTANAWSELTPQVSPPARMYHAMAWDAASNRVIMFGGVARPYEPVFDDTWAFDLRRNTWTQLSPHAAPSARAWHVMAGTQSGVLLFGGSPTHSPFTNDDTWMYRGSRGVWNEVRPCKGLRP